MPPDSRMPHHFYYAPYYAAPLARRDSANESEVVRWTRLYLVATRQS
jgi:hypothetical protein